MLHFHRLAAGAKHQLKHDRKPTMSVSNITIPCSLHLFAFVLLQHRPEDVPLMCKVRPYLRPRNRTGHFLLRKLPVAPLSNFSQTSALSYLPGWASVRRACKHSLGMWGIFTYVSRSAFSKSESGHKAITTKIFAGAARNKRNISQTTSSCMDTNSLTPPSASPWPRPALALTWSPRPTWLPTATCLRRNGCVAPRAAGGPKHTQLHTYTHTCALHPVGVTA